MQKIISIIKAMENDDEIHGVDVDMGNASEDTIISFNFYDLEVLRNEPFCGDVLPKINGIRVSGTCDGTGRGIVTLYFKGIDCIKQEMNNEQKKKK